ncbi:TolC family protein [bacterium]|nr:TolC family protein [bacterium]
MKRILLITLITLVSLFTISQSTWAILDEKKIDIREAIQKALETNPQMQMLNMNVEISKNDTKIAGKLQNPNLDVFYNIGAAAKGDNQQLGVNYLIEILKRGKRKEFAKSKEQVAVNDMLFSQYGLIFEVRKAYIDLLHKKSILDIIKQQRILAKDIYNSIKEDAKKGKVPETEVLQAKISLNRIIMAENNAKYNVVFSQNRFNTVMNTSDVNYDTKEDKLNGDYNDLLTIEPSNDKLEYEKIKEFAINQRYDLQKVRQEVLAAQKKLEVVKSQLVPDLQLSSGYAWTTAHNAETTSGRYGAYALGSIVNIPIVYQYKPEIKNAQLEIEKAQLKYKDTEIDAIRNITDAWERYVITRENLNFYNDEILSNSKELLQAAIKNFKERKIDFTSFLVSKKTYFDLMLDYQQALADYYVSYAELVKEMNVIEIETETDFI